MAKSLFQLSLSLIQSLHPTSECLKLLQFLSYLSLALGVTVTETFVHKIDTNLSKLNNMYKDYNYEDLYLLIFSSSF